MTLTSGFLLLMLLPLPEALSQKSFLQGPLRCTIHDRPNSVQQASVLLSEFKDPFSFTFSLSVIPHVALQSAQVTKC